MKDLIESSRLFEASSRMQTAANTLRLMNSQQVVEASLCANLEWVGHFLQQVDLSTFGQTGISADFAIPATEARPFFYEALADIDNLLHAADIEDDAKLRSFLTDTFTSLTSSGSKSIAPDKISLVATLLERFANAILTRLKRIPPSPIPGFALEMAI